MSGGPPFRYDPRAVGGWLGPQPCQGQPSHGPPGGYYNGMYPPGGPMPGSNYMGRPGGEWNGVPFAYDPWGRPLLPGPPLGAPLQYGGPPPSGDHRFMRSGGYPAACPSGPNHNGPPLQDNGLAGSAVNSSQATKDKPTIERNLDLEKLDKLVADLAKLKACPTVVQSHQLTPGIVQRDQARMAELPKRLERITREESTEESVPNDPEETRTTASEEEIRLRNEIAELKKQLDEKGKNCSSQKTVKGILRKTSAVEPINEAATEDSDSRSVYISRLDYACTDALLEAHFASCGTVIRASILVNSATQRSTGCALVEFAAQADMQRALSMSGSFFRGKQILLRAKKPSVPPVVSDTPQTPIAVSSPSEPSTRSTMLPVEDGNGRPALSDPIKEEDSKYEENEEEGHAMSEPERNQGTPQAILSEKEKAHMTTVTVSNFANSCTEEELRAFFEACGTIVSFTLFWWTPSKAYRAHIQFADLEGRNKALELNEELLFGREIIVVEKETFVSQTQTIENKKVTPARRSSAEPLKDIHGSNSRVEEMVPWVTLPDLRDQEGLEEVDSYWKNDENSFEIISKSAAGEHEISVSEHADLKSYSSEAESDKNSIYVSNFDAECTEEELMDYFASKGCGTIIGVIMLNDEHSKKPNGSAYVEFADQDSRNKALELDEEFIHGRQISVIEKRTVRIRTESENNNDYQSFGSQSDHPSEEDIEANSVFVQNIGKSCTRNELIEYFDACGIISETTILLNHSGQPEGCAYMKFADSEGLRRALEMNGDFFNDRKISVVQSSRL